MLQVHRARCIPFNEEVAVKKMNLESLNVKLVSGMLVVCLEQPLEMHRSDQLCCLCRRTSSVRHRP